MNQTTSDLSLDYTEKVYTPMECAVFKRTKDRFGALSNMASGYPIFINDFVIPSSENLYQAMKFTSFPDAQRQILMERSPMGSKIIATKFPTNMVRSDWHSIKVDVMWWCLRLKLLSNPDRFLAQLGLTEGMNIVELSSKDKFWGTVMIGASLVGTNILGQLLEQLRSDGMPLKTPPSVCDFMIIGENVEEFKQP